MSSYTPRTTAPESNNPYYYSDMNIFHFAGYGMPNCTCYAWGRFYEITGVEPKLSRGDAERWWGYNDGYSRGNSPKLGAVACWSKGSPTTDADGSGHVAIVEEIESDGTIVTSNSAHRGDMFYIDDIAPPYAVSGYTFQGFIYSPIDFSEGRKLPLWMLFKINERRFKH